MRSSKRAAALVIALGLGTAIPTASLQQTASAAPASVAAGTLNRRIVEARFENKTLGEAIEWIREVAGANLTVNWKALAEQGINQDTQINLRLYNVTLRKLLTTVLTEAGNGNSLTYLVDEGVVEITTQQLADARLYVKIYNIEDLLFEVPNFDDAPIFDLSAQQNQGSGGSSGSSGSGGSGGLFPQGNQRTNDQAKVKTKDERAQELVELIIATVRPDVWKENGGPASIRYFNGNLVVSAPASVHEMIGG